MRMIKSAPRRRIIEKPEMPQYLDDIVEAIRFVEKKEKRSIVKRLSDDKYNHHYVIHNSHLKRPQKPLNKGVSADFDNDNRNVVKNKANVVLGAAPKRSDKTAQKIEKKTTKNVINTDWFEATIHIDLKPIKSIDQMVVKIGEEIVLENKNRSTFRYMALWSVFYLGEEIGSIQTHPKRSQRHRPENEAQFKMKNSLCYQVNWLDTYKDLLSESGWEMGNVTRNDIAIDGYGANRGRDLAAKTLKGGITKRKGKAKFHTTRNSKNEIENFRCGNTRSDKVAVIYNKSSEIEHSEKTYIEESWKRNGLEAFAKNEKVERFELRLYSNAMKKYDWTRLDDPTYLASIAKTETKNWFEFYIQSKDKNRYRNDKKNTMDWIDWNEIKGELLPKTKAISKSQVFRAKQEIKNSYYWFVLRERPIQTDFINSLLDDFCLHKWLEYRLDNWIEEFEKEKEREEEESELNSN